ncbi:MAG TPA: alpha/beta hydrolase [Gaiellaceae bacterium]|nr:alpha/beta hydrolase [Gaiellaceae bacterium]
MIVLVHGLGVSHRYFARLRRLLPAAAAPDLAGGTVDVLTWSLEAALAEPSLLVANSLGCQVAAELAVRRPGLVRGLVLIGPTWDPGAPTVFRQFLRLANGSYREPLSLLPVLAYEYARWGPRRLLRTARSMLDHPVADRLACVRVPAVVVRGEHDTICSPPWARLAAGVARARLVQVPGAAHAVHWSHPEAVVQVVEELLQELAEA